MPTTQQIADELYYNLRPGAIKVYNEYILTRTPANLQPAMDAMLAPNTPKVMMSDGQNVIVTNAANAPVAGSPGICIVNPDLTGKVKLTV